MKILLISCTRPSKIFGSSDFLAHSDLSVPLRQFHCGFNTRIIDKTIFHVFSLGTKYMKNQCDALKLLMNHFYL